MKPEAVKYLADVDISALRKKVLELTANEWEDQNEKKPNKFEVFTQTQHIIFRFIDSFMDHRKFTNKANWESWKPLIEPIMAAAVKPYGYAKGSHPRIMLAKLAPQSEIGKHIDKAPAAQVPHKIHVPLVTNAQCFFHVNDQSFYLEEGKAYEVNNNKLHWVTNGGETERIHLIFEYFPT